MSDVVNSVIVMEILDIVKEIKAEIMTENTRMTGKLKELYIV